MTPVNQRERKDPLAELAELADELCDPRQNTETIYAWTRSRHRKLVAVHKTIQPGLLAQLQDAIGAATTVDDTGRRTIPASRPPLLLEALSRHLTIATTANRWIWDLQLENRTHPEANIRALVGAATAIERATLHELLHDVRRWRTWAAVLTGWAAPPLRPHVPCPNPECGTISSLLVDPNRKTGYCTACGHLWDDRDGSINLLAAHIKRESEKPHIKVAIRSSVAGHGGWQTRAGGTV